MYFLHPQNTLRWTSESFLVPCSTPVLALFGLFFWFLMAIDGKQEGVDDAANGDYQAFSNQAGIFLFLQHFQRARNCRFFTRKKNFTPIPLHNFYHPVTKILILWISPRLASLQCTSERTGKLLSTSRSSSAHRWLHFMHLKESFSDGRVQIYPATRGRGK